MGEQGSRPPIMEQLALTEAEFFDIYRELLGDKFIPANRPGSDGWVECWGIERAKGNSPSAAFNVVSGYYTDKGQGPKGQSLIDMLIGFGAKANAREAIRFLKERYRPHLLNHSSDLHASASPAGGASENAGTASPGPAGAPPTSSLPQLSANPTQKFEIDRHVDVWKWCRVGDGPHSFNSSGTAN